MKVSIMAQKWSNIIKGCLQELAQMSLFITTSKQQLVERWEKIIVLVHHIDNKCSIKLPSRKQLSNLYILPKATAIVCLPLYHSHQLCSNSQSHLCRIIVLLSYYEYYDLLL